MTDFLQMVSALREQMNATVSRSDVLKPLAWFIGIVLTATVTLAVGQAREWPLIVMSTIFVLASCLYGYAYLFCLKSDPDALRSEKHSLTKLAIEHGVYGDNVRGVIGHQPLKPNQLALPSSVVAPNSVKSEGAP